MNHSKSKILSRKAGRRSQSGAQLAEFGPALALLVGMILIPLLDLVVIPVRWMLAQDTVNDYCRQLAICETFSDAKSKLDSYPTLESKLQDLGGVKVRSINLRMRITSARGGGLQQSFFASSPGGIPSDWLPNGRNAPCLYTLELDVESSFAPIILFPGMGQQIPGLTAPVPIAISASHAWENLGRDPNNKKFYLAE